MAKLIGIARKAEHEAPMETTQSARIEVETGLSGDYSGKLFKKRQVTVLTREAWEAACAELGEDLIWTTRRANLFVEGLPSLADSKGRRLRIGSALLEITEETEPCHRMDEARFGLRQALSSEWRGGVCCRVLESGDLAVGDAVELIASEAVA